jgi:transposase
VNKSASALVIVLDMKSEPKPMRGAQPGAALFEDLPLLAPALQQQVEVVRGKPRVRSVQRHQVELRACDLDSLLPPDHAARAVWSFVQGLDLEPLYARIRAVQGRAGRAAIDPALLVALWLYATLEGVGSARQIERLCVSEEAWRWLCGGVRVNHHTLADFRTRHVAWLDEQLTRSVAALMRAGLVTMQCVAQDGLRVRAHAKAASFRREPSLRALLGQARQQLERLKCELHEDAAASQRRRQAAQARAAQERQQRLAQALAALGQMQAGADAKSAPAAAARDDEEPPSATPPKPSQPRASTTDAQARVMKMADGGFRPAFNAQLAVDVATQVIVGVQLCNHGSDSGLLQPMHQQLQQRYARVAPQWLADGGYAKLADIEALDRQGTQVSVPLPASRNPATHLHAPKRGDSPAIAQWRARMGTPQAVAIYKQRASSVECVNAQLRRRGLLRFNVCGLLKAQAVLLWHALAHNLQRLLSLKATATTAAAVG